MQKFLLIVLLGIIYNQTVKAEEIMSEDMLLGNEIGVTSETSTNTTDNTDTQTTLKSSLINLIKKPLSLFSSASDQIVSQDGKTETFLEKSIRAAQEGKLSDQMNLGYMYLYGTNGVEQNYEKAFEYYTMAAAQNDSIALNNLGSLYFSGIGTSRNTRKAIELFQQAAELGNDNAAVNLAFIYLTGGTKDEQRNVKAIELYKQAAKQGNNIAKFMLGYAYYKGFVVDTDYAKAYQLIKESAEDDVLIDEAQMVQGEMLIEGIGTVQNYQKGVGLIRAAAGQGNLEAIMVAAKIYALGKYVPQNLLMSHALYNIAAAHDVAGAAEFRDEVASKLKLEQLTQAQTNAQQFTPNPSELTTYIRKTFGENIRRYIDNNR